MLDQVTKSILEICYDLRQMPFLPLIYVRTTEDFTHLGFYLITETNYLQKHRFNIKQDDQES